MPKITHTVGWATTSTCLTASAELSGQCSWWDASSKESGHDTGQSNMPCMTDSSNTFDKARCMTRCDRNYLIHTGRFHKMQMCQTSDAHFCGNGGDQHSTPCGTTCGQDADDHRPSVATTVTLQVTISWSTTPCDVALDSSISECGASQGVVPSSSPALRPKGRDKPRRRNAGQYTSQSTTYAPTGPKAEYVPTSAEPANAMPASRKAGRATTRQRAASRRRGIGGRTALTSLPHEFAKVTGHA